MPDYIELHTHSYYSLLDGTSSPNKLIQSAYELGMPALALTDHNNLYGAVQFSQSAKSSYIKPIFGSEITMEDSSHLTLLVRNQKGWENLCNLITIAQHNAPKGQAKLPYSSLISYSDGLVCLTGCRQGVISNAIQNQDQGAAEIALSKYRNWFSKNMCGLSFNIIIYQMTQN